MYGIIERNDRQVVSIGFRIYPAIGISDVNMIGADSLNIGRGGELDVRKRIWPVMLAV
jgi:hypothetical protein